jgi:hypothetical protein
MNPLEVKMISLYQTGAFTASAVASTFLYNMLVDDAEDAQVLSLVSELPSEIQRSLFTLLRDIRRGNFIWRPLLIGPGLKEETVEQRNPKILARICELLDIDRG